MTPDVLELLKRRLGPSLQNRDQNPRAVFGEKVEQVNSSNHYSAKAMTAADVPNLSLEAMRSFYNARFGNAADFTYFFVGAFTEAEITPLLEKWVGVAAVDREEDLRRARHGREVPGRGREGRSEEGQGAGEPDACCRSSPIRASTNSKCIAPAPPRRC